MTNKERYKKAFQTLHSSGQFSLEVEMMEKRKHVYHMKKVVAACAATAILFGSMTVAYAADLGGIQQKITAWFHGEQTQVNVKDNGNGSYTFTFTDENGKKQAQTGGGVAFDDNGNEIQLSAEDLAPSIGNFVEADNDGKVWLYYYDKKIDVTEMFGEDGICKVALEHEGETVYFKIDGSTKDAVTRSFGYESRTDAPADAENYIFVE
ncbi:MAG: hypothetical protein K2N87_20655 [Eubacterium sp.]|nr:hypothetical protein [Eubacterium sp.]